MNEKEEKNSLGVADESLSPTQAHTPLPWEAVGARIWKGERCLFDGHAGADFPNEREANATFVVKCVNQSPAFRKLRDALANMCDKFYPHQCKFHGSTICDRCEALRQASGVLRLVNGQAASEQWGF